MSNKDKDLLLQLLEAKEKNFKYRKFESFYFQDHMIDPANGTDISRDKYVKHVQFMNAGAKYRERAVIAPNRSGKTEMGSYEWTCHLTKQYPDWWEGKRFKGPVLLLCVGKTHLAVRNVLQKKLLGRRIDLGTGMIPHADHNNGVGIVSTTSKTGTANAILDAYIRDVNGDLNQVMFLSQEMDAGVIMGDALHGIWFDEECLNRSFYNEAVARTVTTDGIVMHTFTPLDGITETIMDFLPQRTVPEDGVVKDSFGVPTGRYCINFSLQDTPHLTDEQKAYQFALYPEGHRERSARCYGIPTIGAGQVYPIPLSYVTVDPFPIPQTWLRAYGMDFGWNETAVVWAAEDPNTGIRYIYSDYHRGQTLPYAHAAAIKGKGEWIPGACDPAGMQSNQRDGSKVIEEYSTLGLNLVPGVRALESGVARIQNQLESGKLKVFSTCQHFLDELALYRYNDHGKIAEHQDDHELDAYRYLDSQFDYIAVSEIEWMKQDNGFYDAPSARTTRDTWSGY